MCSLKLVGSTPGGSLKIHLCKSSKFPSNAPVDSAKALNVMSVSLQHRGTLDICLSSVSF